MITLGPIFGAIYTISNNKISIAVGFETSCNAKITLQVKSKSNNIINITNTDSIQSQFKVQRIIVPKIDKYFLCLTCICTGGIYRSYGSFSLGPNISVISCNHHIPYSIPLEFLSTNTPHLCIHNGDNIYMDEVYKKLEDDYNPEIGWKDMINIFQEQYRKNWSSIDMKQLLSSCTNIFLGNEYDICKDWEYNFTLPSGWKHMIKGNSIDWEKIYGLMITPREKIIVASIAVYCQYQLALSTSPDQICIPGSFHYVYQDKHILFLDRRMHIVGGIDLVPPTITKIDMLISPTPIGLLPSILCNSVTKFILEHILSNRIISNEWIFDKYDLFNILSYMNDTSICICGAVGISGKSHLNISLENKRFEILQLTSSGISKFSRKSLLLRILRLLRQFKSICRISLKKSTLYCIHESWTSESSYIRFNINNPIATHEFITESLIHN